MRRREQNVMTDNQRSMVKVPHTRVRIGLTPEEGDRLALELAKMEAELNEPGLSAIAGFDLEGAVTERRSWLESSVPAHEVDVGPFEIDVYPVTNAQWSVFMKDTGAAKPDGPGLGVKTDFVTGVSWQEARAFAQHYELDLPSEAEWECAARNDRSFFTWGDRYFPQGNVAFKEPVYKPYSVGTRPELRSSKGLHDLLSQFGEYCNDKLAPYEGTNLALWQEHFPDWRSLRVVRGGYDIRQDATCVSRRGVPETERRTHIKFRCVRRG